MKLNYVGIVISRAMPKTAKVRVAKEKFHPVVKKYVTQYQNYMVQDDLNCNVGDAVTIQPCRPRSATKRFEIIKILSTANRMSPASEISKE
ncbi:mitochondrial ribosomal protein subunit S17 [Schizosaccharomyces pombe]|uniref:Small ribosomal subunit protein uS17m n=1 Tax=Schizosaccharomyces pombe (strain 972 / ATCC 24843) TaxID=284812 RepID=RT17_SCHPO|nr:putative mitochondrial ribosomal protein subunit S17 [Schizosaccharomyces pombe]Q9UUB0.1 RecName: Full=Small ribosomal subunit protein uS17m; AltName: Full=37S ribosomal protein S17, mitochondrial [Schizosaccharomyces pombe 972h-]CAB52616.1 mitochondrial ribosomal protein subunit S17 (predicted) [Schizosaccharomyces pombe]|eukprot:NP_595464.1 putative mitochondrial ribosomal protein subunit S17 [Schizosaccharomyces pombe]